MTVASFFRTFNRSLHSTAASIRPLPPFNAASFSIATYFHSTAAFIRSWPSFLIVAFIFDRCLVFYRGLDSTVALIRPRPSFRAQPPFDRGLFFDRGIQSIVASIPPRPSVRPRTSIDRGLLFDRGLQSIAASI